MRRRPGRHSDNGGPGGAAGPDGKDVRMQDLLELVRTNPYPGRGIVVGKDRVYY